MAYGIELHLGFVGAPAVFDFAARAGIAVENVDGEPITLEQFMSGSVRRIELSDDLSTLTAAAYEAVLDRLGWEWRLSKRRGYYHVSTPHGPRETVPFSLEISWDRYEMGHEPADAMVGVALTSRYFPCLLDVKDPYGAVDPIVLDGDAMELLLLARRELEARITALEGAYPFVHTKHY